VGVWQKELQVAASPPRAVTPFPDLAGSAALQRLLTAAAG